MKEITLENVLKYAALMTIYRVCPCCNEEFTWNEHKQDCEWNEIAKKITEVAEEKD